MRRLARLALLVLAALAATTAEAQVYRFKVYNSNTGLPSNATYGVYQDAQGFLWFATDGGACRFDGAVYRTFGVGDGLPDASVRGFLEDGRGGLWILTKGGLARWDGVRLQTFDHARGLGHDEVRAALRARDGTSWFGTTAGLSAWDGQRFVNYGTEAGLPASTVWALHEDHEGTLWVGTRGGGLGRFRDGRWRRVTQAEGDAGASVFDVAEEPGGRLWFATDDGLRVREDGRFRALHVADGLPSEQVSSVLVDSQGRLWAGTFGAGAVRFEKDGRVTRFNRRHGIPDDYLTSMLEDAEGNIWFGSMWSGAFRLITERFSLWGKDLGLPDGHIATVAEDSRGGLWFGAMNGGLARLDASGRVDRWGAAQGLSDDRVWGLLVDREDRVWVGGLSGVFVLEKGRFRAFTLQELKAFDRVNALAQDARGWIWMGSGAGRSTAVLAWDGTRMRRFGPAEGLPTVQVNSIAATRDGRVWLATEDGLVAYDGQAFTRYTREHGLPARRVLVAREDDTGQLWVGTSGGLARLEGSRFRAWRTKDGLVNDFVSALLDTGGALWVGTARGVSVFDGVRFENYTLHQGLPLQEIVTGSGLRQRDGSLWFGTPGGGLRYRPVVETARPRPPRVLLRGLRVRDEPAELGPRLEVAHDHRHLTVDFVGLSFADEEAVRYTTMLEGLDTAWSPPDAARSIRLMNLPPGSYTLLVRARSGSGPWGEPARLAIRVRPALWQQPAMQILALGLLAGLAYGGYVWRLSQVTEQHRARLAMHLELLASIRVINSTLDLPAVLQSIAAEAARLVDGEPGGIGLVRDGRVTFARLYDGTQWNAVHHEVDVGEGVPGRVASTGVALRVNDPAAGSVTGYPSELQERFAAGFIEVPILDRTGVVVGVLDVRRPRHRDAFTDDDLRLLEALAPQAAVAIENAGLYGTLEEKKIALAESLWAIDQLYRNEQHANRILQELNDMKTSFMIVTSHEMRTPLTILKGHHEALLGGYLGAIAPAQGATLQICQRNVDRMSGIFDDVLEMMKIDRRAPLRPQPLDIAAELGHVLQEMSQFIERRHQSFEVDSETGLPVVVADAGKLHLVFENLLQNAIKFTPDGGRIRVRVRSEGDHVHVVVEDEGIGIAADELERVFDRFYTTRDDLHHASGSWQFLARGAGLGLAIARGYVEAHGGRIWAESAGRDRGSSFHVLLPVSAEHAPPPDAGFPALTSAS